MALLAIAYFCDVFLHRAREYYAITHGSGDTYSYTVASATLLSRSSKPFLSAAIPTPSSQPRPAANRSLQGSFLILVG